MAYEYPICDVFNWFCRIARFFVTEQTYRVYAFLSSLTILQDQNPTVTKYLFFLWSKIIIKITYLQYDKKVKETLFRNYDYYIWWSSVSSSCFNCKYQK